MVQFNRAKGSKLTLANSQNAGDFDTLRAKKSPLANVCEVESSMSPKLREIIWQWSHQTASGKKSS